MYDQEISIVTEMKKKRSRISRNRKKEDRKEGGKEMEWQSKKGERNE